MSCYIHEVPSEGSYGREAGDPGNGDNGIRRPDGGTFLYEVRSGGSAGMGVAEDASEYKIDFVFDKETLSSYFEVILGDNPCAPDCLAQVLVRFKEAIESGEEGVARAIKTLSDGLEMMYLRTEVHQAALKLYTLSQLGYVRPQDEPMAVLGPAIERSLAESGPSERSAKPAKKRRRAA